MKQITLEDLQEVRLLLNNSRKQEMTKLFAEFLDKHSPDSAKRVREEGLPKVIYCPDDVCGVFGEALDQYVEVVKFSQDIMGKNICILSWIEQESICFQVQVPWSVVDSKPEFIRKSEVLRENEL